MKTLKRVEVKKVEYSEFLPNIQDLEQDVIYVSEKYGGTSHLCFCGCGNLIYIPINKGTATWQFTKHDNGKVSFTPSLLHRLECKSHYIITKNIVNFV